MVLQNEKGETLFLLTSIQDDFTPYDKAKVRISGLLSDTQNLPMTFEVYRIDELVPPPPPEKIVLVKPALQFWATLPTGWTEVPKTEKKIILQNKKGDTMMSIALLSKSEMEALKEKMTNADTFSIGNHSAIRSHSEKTTQILMTQEPFLSLYFEGGAEEKFAFYEFLTSISFENLPAVSPSPSPTEKSTEADSVPTASPLLDIASAQEKQAVLQYFQENLAHIAPVQKPWAIQTFSFYEGNTVDIVYGLKGAEYRTVFEYHISSAGNIVAKPLVHYEPGITNTWRVVSGTPQKFSQEPDIFMKNTSTPIRLPEGFALFINTAVHFQMAYPKNLYYAVDNTQKGNSLSRSFFFSSPADEKNAVITVEVLDGKEEKERELDLETIVPRDDLTHFSIRAKTPEYIPVLRKMAKTVRMAEAF